MTVVFETYSDVHRSAEISDCGRYRWWLRRSWRRFEDGLHIPGRGVCCFVMLNPSIADGTQDDPTIRRCIGFAKSWGYNILSVRNLFPWRATDPKELLSAESVTGGHRGDAELLTACTSDIVVLAWGANVPFGRDAQALKMFAEHFPGVPLNCLKMTKSGHPQHPLYVKADTRLIPFKSPYAIPVDSGSDSRAESANPSLNNC